MLRTTLVALTLSALASSALAASYPVSGKWGESNTSDKGPIDCTGKRVIAFNGNQRTDSKGGVPAYRNKSITPESTTRWRVTDEFSTGQIRNGTVTYSLVQIDPDHLALDQQKGGTIRLQRCK